MSKAKKILIAILVGLVGYPIVINLTQKTDIHYLPFVEPIRNVPVLLLMLLCFAAGSLTLFLFQIVRGKKKATPPK